MNKKLMIKMINRIIDVWEEDNMNLSFPDHKHPAFYLVKKLAEEDKDLVITTILKRMQKEFTFFGSILYDIIPKKDQPKITKKMRGKMQEITDRWIKWGIYKGYIE